MIFIVLMVKEFTQTQNKVPLYLSYILALVIGMTIKDPAPTLLLPLLTLSLYAILIDRKIGRDVILLTISFALVAASFVYIQYLYFSIPTLALSLIPLGLIKNRYNSISLKFDEFVGKFGYVTIQIIVAIVVITALTVNIITYQIPELSQNQNGIY